MISKATSAIKAYPASFLFLAFALFLPEMTNISLSYWPTFIFSQIDKHLALCFGISFLVVNICYAFSKIHRTLGSIALTLFHVLFFSVCMIDVFLYKFFGTHINVSMLQLLNETNAQESSEFLETYILNPSFLSIVKTLLLLIASEIIISYCCKWAKKRLHGRNSSSVASNVRKTISYVTLVFCLLCVCYTVIVAPVFSFNWTNNRVRIYESKLLIATKIPSSFIYNTYQAFVQFADEGASFDKCAKSQQEIEIEPSTTPIQSKIIVIIGESFNRHHSSLYGYDHLTNPKLGTLDSLCVFDNVISSVNVTSASFKNFLSLSSVDDSLQWCEAPLFPAIFKKAGYNVIFFSNQFVKEAEMSPNDASCGFFNMPLIEPYLFTHRNSQKYQYDEQLIDAYKLQKDTLETDSLNLVIFHLMGQHVRPRMRYPEGRALFKACDYNRPELTEGQRQEVADYDNATYYNDSIANEIINLYREEDAIVVYFADHGDEANDYRAHIGRSLLNDEMGAPCLHCQLDVPFFIFLSDSCRIKHPNLADRITKSTHRPFMTDDLPHLLLDIANINTKWYNPNRSLINDHFNSNRKRFVYGYSFDEPTDYDAICNKYGNWEIVFSADSLVNQ